MATCRTPMLSNRNQSALLKDVKTLVSIKTWSTHSSGKAYISTSFNGIIIWLHWWIFWQLHTISILGIPPSGGGSWGRWPTVLAYVGKGQLEAGGIRGGRPLLEWDWSELGGGWSTISAFALWRGGGSTIPLKRVFLLATQPNSRVWCWGWGWNLIVSKENRSIFVGLGWIFKP